MNYDTANQKVLGNCPACQRLMQIPVVTDVASVAKCPHCQNEVRVRDLLASAVPEAEIISNDEDANKNHVSDYVADRQRVYDTDKSKKREKFEVPNQLYNGASRRNRKRRNGSKGRSSQSSSSRGSSSRDSSPRRRPNNNGDPANSQVSRGSGTADVSYKVGDSSVTPNSNTSPQSSSVTSSNRSTAASNSVSESSPKPANRSPQPAQDRSRPTSRPRPTPRPRPARSSSGRRSSEMDDEVELGVADVLKFLVGGLIAAPLAYLALLWVLGVDPFGMASTFERISPSIIPDSLRNDFSSDEPQSGFAPPAGDSSSALFGTSSDGGGLEDGFEDEGLPMPSLDPDMVR